MRRIAPLACAVLVAACSLPTETPINRVELTVEPEAIATGDSLSAWLVNRSELTVQYSFCPAALERRTEGSWWRVQQPFGVPAGTTSMCIGIAYELPPGDKAEYRQLVTADVESGLYRLRMNVTIGDSNSSLSSSVFRVLP